MIALIFGVPGSGKTYWAVHTIRKKCLQESDIFFRVKDDVLLITNLRLRLDDPTNYIFIENWEDWLRFLNIQFWQGNLSWWQNKRVWIVMDECQRFFYLAKENPEVWFYLQYHRHLSHNLIFITQTPKSIPGKLYELCEFVIEAVPKSVNIFSVAGFRYRVLSPLDKSLVLRRFHIPYDKLTFYLYNDMIYEADEEIRPQNAFIKPALYVFLAVLGVLISLYVFFSGLSQKIQAQTQAQTQTTQTQANITYEDLIEEEKPHEPPKQGPNPMQAKQGPNPMQEIRPLGPKPAGYYYITLEKRSHRERENIDLVPEGPKIVEIP